ncbi:hypothetical protein HY626_04405 [Candidatus Uhrbacteria bacterium]|nr:hypothetical protein [Candidatus Uhrbacteria bacterium]
MFGGESERAGGRDAQAPRVPALLDRGVDPGLSDDLTGDVNPTASVRDLIENPVWPPIEMEE